MPGPLAVSESNARKPAPQQHKVVVASRFAAPPKAAAGLPSVRSQLETQKAAARTASEQLETIRRSAVVTRATLLSALEDADRAIDSLTSELAAANSAAQSLRQQVSTLQAERKEQQVRSHALEEQVLALQNNLQASRAQNAQIKGELAEAHDALACARDLKLPAAARDTETQRVRADQEAERAAKLTRLLKARDAVLRDFCTQFETVRSPAPTTRSLPARLQLVCTAD